MNSVSSPVYRFLQGDIVQTLLPKHMPSGEIVDARRNLLVLAVDYDTGLDRIVALRTARFSYNFQKFDPVLDWNAQEAQRRGFIAGLWRPAILRVDSIDLIDVEHDEIIQTVGRVDAIMFPTIAGRLQAAMGDGPVRPASEPTITVAPTYNTTPYIFPGVPTLSSLPFMSLDAPLLFGESFQRAADQQPQDYPTPMPECAWNNTIRRTARVVPATGPRPAWGDPAP